MTYCQTLLPIETLYSDLSVMAGYVSGSVIESTLFSKKANDKLQQVYSVTHISICADNNDVSFHHHDQDVTNVHMFPHFGPAYHPSSSDQLLR